MNSAIRTKLILNYIKYLLQYLECFKRSRVSENFTKTAAETKPLENFWRAPQNVLLKRTWNLIIVRIIRRIAAIQNDFGVKRRTRLYRNAYSRPRSPRRQHLSINFYETLRRQIMREKNLSKKCTTLFHLWGTSTARKHIPSAQRRGKSKNKNLNITRRRREKNLVEYHAFCTR